MRNANQIIRPGSGFMKPMWGRIAEGRIVGVIKENIRLKMGNKLKEATGKGI